MKNALQLIFIMLSFFGTSTFSQTTTQSNSLEPFILINNHKSIDQVLDFLSAIDENLYKIPDSRKRHISNLHSKLSKNDISDSDKNLIFGELWRNPEYYIWKIEKTNSDAIQSIRFIKNNYSPNQLADQKKNFIKNLSINQRIKESDDPFKTIIHFMDAGNKLKIALDTQYDSLENLGRLGSLSMLVNVNIRPDESYFYRTTIYSSVFENLIKDYAEIISEQLR